MSNPDRVVVNHLCRLIQDSADVRYHVGGPHTLMRDLLVASIVASGYEGDPLDVLRPAEHRASEEARVVRLDREVDRLENGIEVIRRELASGDYERVTSLVARLQSGESI